MKLNKPHQHISFVAVDWGTSSFRLWVVAADGTIIDATEGPFGMSRLKPAEFNGVLETALSERSIGTNVPVIICGMAGAAQGWCEAPYLQTPTRLDELGAQAIKVPGIARDVRILPGVKQMSPANVMRGEETQIAGLLLEQPDFEGIVCLPGTHTKWVRVQDASVIEFETCLTGEQFAFFSKSSVLSHSMNAQDWSDAAFRKAVTDAVSDPAALPRLLFAIRAEMLIGEQTPAEARARLSGLLIGQESMAVKPYWTGQNVALIGPTQLCRLYQVALDSVQSQGTAFDPTQMTLAGLRAAQSAVTKCHVCADSVTAG